MSDRDRERRGRVRINEEYAIVLDYLPYGNPYSNRQSPTPIIQAMGVFYFTLFEATPGLALGQVKPGEKIYVGPDVSYNYIRINAIISYDDLTPASKKTLDEALTNIIKEREKDFVDFLNKSSPITTRLHQLELIPGIGKKIMWKALDERKLAPFQSFEDFEKRVGVKNLAQAIKKRIIEEMQGKDNFRLFVRYSRRLNPWR
ncbi:MAG: DUF655 domain-containing protein [Thermoprotei archaeon]